MTNELIKKKVEAEIDVEQKMGDIRIYKFVLEVVDHMQSRADEFMLSIQGGYTEGQLNKIKFYIEHRKRKYSQELKPGNQAYA